MSVAVLKQQSTLDEYGFDNSYNSRGLRFPVPQLTSTPPKPSMDEQAENVRNYLLERQKVQGDEAASMIQSPKDIGQSASLYQGDDVVDGYTADADYSRGVLRGGDQSEYPDYLDPEVDWQKLPHMRDYFSRQSTLPEHMWDLNTEGEHFDKEGNILPGAIPPVNAVKLIGGEHNRRGGAPNVGKRTGYGLAPNVGSQANESYEDALHLGQPIMPTNRGVGFVSPPYQNDMSRVMAANVNDATYSSNGLFGTLRDDPEARLVGIRGFGAPQDKAFVRPSVSEGREGAYTAPIPPERLVGVFNRGRQNQTDFPQIEDELKHLNPDERRDATEKYLPKIWEGGRFGLDNPAYTAEEKKLITREIDEKLGKRKDRAAGRGGLTNAEWAKIEERARKSREGTLHPTERFDYPRGNDNE